MKGYAYIFPKHIKIEISERDIPKLKNGEILKYKDKFPSENDILNILFSITKEELSPQGSFTEKGFYVEYFPLGNSEEITTCCVKIDRSKFEELLEKDWVCTRHNGADHLHIQIYKLLGNQ